MRYRIRKVKITFLKRLPKKSKLAASVLGGLLLLATQGPIPNTYANESENEVPQGCLITPYSAQTLMDCCCTESKCSSESCTTDTCANETCSADSCTSNSCSNDTCKMDSCNSETCQTNTCSSDTCNSDSCKSGDQDTCSTSTCSSETCSYDSCRSNSCSSETCSTDKCTTDSCTSDTCAVATCSYDSCDTAICGTDGCNYKKGANGVELGHVPYPDGDACKLQSFGAAVPKTGIAHLNLLNGAQKHIPFNTIEVKAGQRVAINYQMVFRPDAAKNSTYKWLVAMRSTRDLHITGTTSVGPYRGVLSTPRTSGIVVTPTKDTQGKTEWLRFEIHKDGVVIHERYVFIKVK